MGAVLETALGGDGIVARVVALLAAGGFRTVIVEGDAGIGKSTVFNETVRSITECGWVVLVARPTEAESELPYVGLTDLLSACGEVIDQLPTPLRDALDRALLRAGADGGIERHAVGRATAELLDRLAARGPLLIAVDDIQWLDTASAAALSFALRRHQAATSAALLTRRSGLADEGLWSTGIAHEVVPVGPMDPDQLDHLLRRRLDVSLSRPRLAELHRLSLGNPLHAIEIARAAASDDNDDGSPLAVPHTLAAAIEQRLKAVGDTGVEATLVVALAGDTDERTVRGVLRNPAGLDDAVRQGTLEVTRGERIRCAHPMFASVVMGLASPWEVRRVHRSLAAVVTDEDARLRHRALGAEEPDDELSAELEAAAERQAGRAAPESAALLAHSAATLSTDDAARRRRTFAETNYLLAAGETSRAQRTLEALIEVTSDARERAPMLLLLADTVGDAMPRAIELAHQALAAADGDPGLVAQCHGLLEVLTWLEGDVATSAEHCRLAAQCAEEAGEEALVAASFAELCHLEVLLECRYDEAKMDRALEIETRVSLPVTISPTFVKGLVSTFIDDPATARPLLDVSLARATAAGDELLRASVLFRLAELDLRVGRWGDALRQARTFNDIAQQAQTAHEQAVAMGAVALIAAHVGLVEEARAAGEQALDLAQRIGDRMSEVRSRAALGFLALSLGDVRGARALLEPAQAVLDRMALAELSIHHVTVNLIDARLFDGDLAGAEALIERVSQGGGPAGRSWHRVIANRGDAMLAAARGDLVDAVLAAGRAVDAAALLPQPFEVARTLLVFGDVARRAGRRAEARSALNSALEQFDVLGAPLWSDRAATNLMRIAGRAPSAEHGLTQMERSVAELAALGRTNREIAAELFIAVRTVESNLTRVYTKLGVRSRVELVAHLKDH